MKFSSFTLVLTCFLTTVCANIELIAPSNPVSGGSSTVTWTHDASDPAQFVLMLQLASDSWATGQFWEFVETELDKLDVTFLNTDPYVISTTSIYRLTARNQSNVDQVYARSPTFQFLPPGSVTTTTTSINATTTTTSQNSTTVINTMTTSSSTTAATTTTPQAVQQTTTSPTTGTSAAGGEPSGGVLGSNTNAANQSTGGGVVGVVVAVLAAGLASFM